ncbi:hypothetical protein B5X24_HaOG207319 [Helicoverpa armigera]|uniref:YqaJ viral recombinase domain-containing protein n=1 Tax=Helicoverpa armigera TaxID=29058 RepID=A0A2W1BM52_HELAM|nr:hypothetical protein B5X24_HaOG207319 [Helicoverpa armigera]
MITASNFGIVAKRKETSSKAKLVQNILYQPNLAQIRPVAHGLENERFALQQLALQEKVTVEPCGLFVDQEYPFIGATPDGLIGNDMIVEIKCPLVAYKIGIDSAIKQNKIQIWRFDRKTNQIVLNKNSNWFYQVQGQLHVTGRKKCLFGVWSGENHPIKTEFIDRDDGFWETRIKTKIISFYMDWLLPEIIDSRQARGLPLRESDSSKDNTQCTKRSRSRTEDAEEEPYRKIKHILGLTTSSSPDENLPSCSRQLKFEEM